MVLELAEVYYLPLNTTADGEATSMYFACPWRPRGIVWRVVLAVGSDIEYADEIDAAKAIENQNRTISKCWVSRFCFNK